MLLEPCKPKIVRRFFKARRYIHNISFDPDVLRKE